MTTRREMVLGGAGAIVFASGCCSCAQQASPTGCLLSPEGAQRRLFNRAGMRLFALGDPRVIQNSGNRDLDFALAQTLAMMADALNVLPGFGYYDDFDGMNALATSERMLSPVDGTVLFGTRLLRSLLAQPERPELAVAMVCAHEFGHILQYQRNLIRSVQGWDATVRRVELHADFLAGFFAGVRKRERPSFPAVVFATAARGLGDFDSQSADHHGTPSERAAAIIQGYETAYRDRRTLDEAVDIGVKYVRSF